MEEGGHEPVFIESFFFITSRLFPKSSAKVERNEKKKCSFHNLKKFETFS